MNTAETGRPAITFRLLRYFSIASLLALVLALVGIGFFFREIALKQIVKFGEDNNVNLARAFSNSLRQHYIPLIDAAAKLSTAQLKASATLAAVDKAITDAVRQTQVVRVKIYDLEGRTIYSSEPRQIGEDRTGSAGFKAARAGGVLTVLYPRESRSSAETFGERDVLASYVPVRRAGSAEIDAVFEVYSDLTPFFDDIKRTQRDLRFGVGTVLVLLYGALFFIVKRADDVIRHQTRQGDEDAATIRHLAHHDTLTGLPNRKLFNDRLSITLARVKRSGRMAALMFVDFDRFKEINDTFGHAAGDEVLQEAGRRLRAVLRESDTVARLGGDEFTIILEDVSDAGRVRTVAEKIRQTFSEPVRTGDGIEVAVTPSTGIALYPVDADNIDALLKAADSAMYDAKAAGRNAYRFYGAEPAAG